MKGAAASGEEAEPMRDAAQPAMDMAEQQVQMEAQASYMQAAEEAPLCTMTDMVDVQGQAAVASMQQQVDPAAAVTPAADAEAMAMDVAAELTVPQSMPEASFAAEPPAVAPLPQLTPPEFADPMVQPVEEAVPPKPVDDPAPALAQATPAAPVPAEDPMPMAHAEEAGAAPMEVDQALFPAR